MLELDLFQHYLEQQNLSPSIQSREKLYLEFLAKYLTSRLSSPKSSKLKFVLMLKQTSNLYLTGFPKEPYLSEVMYTLPQPKIMLVLEIYTRLVVQQNLLPSIQMKERFYSISLALLSRRIPSLMLVAVQYSLLAVLRNRELYPKYLLQILLSMAILSIELHYLILALEIYTRLAVQQSLSPSIQSREKLYLVLLDLRLSDLQYLKLSLYKQISLTKMSKYISSDMLLVLVLFLFTLTQITAEQRYTLVLAICLHYQMQISRNLSLTKEILHSSFLVLQQRKIQNLILVLVPSLHSKEQQNLLPSYQQQLQQISIFLAMLLLKLLPEKLVQDRYSDLEEHQNPERFLTTTLLHSSSSVLRSTKYRNLMLLTLISRLATLQPLALSEHHIMATEISSPQANLFLDTANLISVNLMLTLVASQLLLEYNVMRHMSTLMLMENRLIMLQLFILVEDLYSHLAMHKKLDQLDIGQEVELLQFLDSH